MCRIHADQSASLAELKWFEVFKDDRLQARIRRALVQNYDLREAVARVDVARASLGITRSNQFPNVAAGGSVEINRVSRDGTTPLPPEILPRRIATSDRSRSACYRSKSISGEASGAPPKLRARIF